VYPLAQLDALKTKISDFISKLIVKLEK
jgi:hypothetical protein